MSVPVSLSFPVNSILFIFRSLFSLQKVIQVKHYNYVYAMLFFRPTYTFQTQIYPVPSAMSPQILTDYLAFSAR